MPLPKAGNTRQNQAFNLSQNFVAIWTHSAAVTNPICTFTKLNQS